MKSRPKTLLLIFYNNKYVVKKFKKRQKNLKYFLATKIIFSSHLTPHQVQAKREINLLNFFFQMPQHFMR